MLALNLKPPSSSLKSNPFKNPSFFPPISSLKLRASSSFSSNNNNHFPSNPTNLPLLFPKFKFPFLPSNPRSHLPTPPSSSTSSPTSYPPSKNLKLALVFGLWYFQNIVFNIYNKKVLNIFPFPWLLASFQLFVGSICMLFIWSFKLQPPPKITKPFIVALLGPALFHTIGHISACVSFSKVAVSFTHVIKSSEPVFSVIFSTFLGDSYSVPVWLSILPIVFGCSLAAVTEVSFNLQGLWGALISNVGFVLRNIYSKKSLQSFKEVDGLNLYGWISIISFFYLFPVAVFVEGSQWVQGYHKAIESIGKPMTFYIWVLVSGVFYHLYNQSSYQALDEISPLTFSVGNTMKRVVVIVSTVLVFRNPVRPLNALGSAIAILGTFLYSQANAAEKAKKKLEGSIKQKALQSPNLRMNADLQFAPKLQILSTTLSSIAHGLWAMLHNLVYMCRTQKRRRQGQERRAGEDGREKELVAGQGPGLWQRRLTAVPQWGGGGAAAPEVERERQRHEGREGERHEQGRSSRAAGSWWSRWVVISATQRFCNSALRYCSRLPVMGQILDKIQGKEWRKKQINKITDKVFDRVQTQTGRITLSFEELYITVLIVYNDINKYLPGPHFDPPSKDDVRALMQKCDMNLDGELSREEFVKFMLELTADTFNTVSQGLIISLVVAPTVALATKRATEGVPGVGKVVQKLPNSMYASLFTLVVVAIQSASQGY